MKSSLNAILDKALAGKVIAKQEGVDEIYWGTIILHAGPSNSYSYSIKTNHPFYPWVDIVEDFKLEVE